MIRTLAVCFCLAGVSSAQAGEPLEFEPFGTLPLSEQEKGITFSGGIVWTHESLWNLPGDWGKQGAVRVRAYDAASGQLLAHALLAHHVEQMVTLPSGRVVAVGQGNVGTVATFLVLSDKKIVTQTMAETRLQAHKLSALGERLYFRAIDYASVPKAEQGKAQPLIYEMDGFGTVGRVTDRPGWGQIGTRGNELWALRPAGEAYVLSRELPVSDNEIPIGEELFAPGASTFSDLVGLEDQRLVLQTVGHEVSHLIFLDPASPAERVTVSVPFRVLATTRLGHCLLAIGGNLQRTRQELAFIDVAAAKPAVISTWNLGPGGEGKVTQPIDLAVDTVTSRVFVRSTFPFDKVDDKRRFAGVYAVSEANGVTFDRCLKD